MKRTVLIILVACATLTLSTPADASKTWVDHPVSQHR